MEHFLAYIFIEAVDSYISKGKFFHEQSKVFHSELNYQNNKVFAKTLMHFLSVSRPFSSIPFSSIFLSIVKLVDTHG